jgi:signal transduction histidine kinase
VTRLDRVTVASRVFCIAAILGLGLLSRDYQALVSLVIISTVALTAVYVALTTPLAAVLVIAIEAAVTGMVIGVALPGGVVLLPYLVVLTLIAGISRGVVGVSAVVIVQFFSIALIAVAWATSVGGDELFRFLSPWLLTSIGVGLLGAWLRQIGKVPQTSQTAASYESAHRLLTQLRTVARRLSSGLDPVAIANHMQEDVLQALGAIRTAVFMRPEGGVFSPLAYSDATARVDLATTPEVTDECWNTMQPVIAAADQPDVPRLVALPLRVGSRMTGVVLAQAADAPSKESLKSLMQQLDEQSLRLETALVFDELRSIATVEERRRLAREIHDGIAQEVASLGYVVDELMAEAESARQRSNLASLRQELSRVVSELRLSIFDLRSDVLRETGLGAALSEYLREVGSRSAMAVHLTLDEAPTRLRAETEIELLRIAQEAITNARKHSGADNLWVDCRVKPPFAELVVRDDGSGLSRGRSDSYGLRIMKERAERIDARLEVRNVPGPKRRGTVVSVTLGDRPGATKHTESEQVDVRS